MSKFLHLARPQAGRGNPQAIYGMVDKNARVVDKRQIREVRQEAELLKIGGPFNAHVQSMPQNVADRVVQFEAVGRAFSDLSGFS